MTPACDRRAFLTWSAAALASAALAGCGGAGGSDDAPRVRYAADPPPPGTPQILIAGGGFQTAYIGYLAALTGKRTPRLCYLPTATGDRQSAIDSWYASCDALDVDAHHQETFISSNRMDQSFSDVLLSMDGIVVSGGNTLNQQVIWRAHGIDTVLREAWERGIVLGGASAGSICWFEAGTTDSRPKALSRVDALGFLPGSHSPHYDGEAERRPTYHRMIASGELPPGWACDNDAGILFHGTKPVRFVTTREDARVYYVDLVDGQVVETVHEPEMLVTA
jgi:peptidase E